MNSQDEASPPRQPSRRDRGRPRKRPLSPDSTETTNKTPKTSPYNRNFEQHLIDHGVYIAEHEYPDGRTVPEPNNLQEIQERLLQRRLSLSPSRFTDEDFKNFRRANTQSTKENKVLSVEVPLIEGGVRDGKCVSGQIPFTNLEALTDGTIVSGNPDRYYGARPEQLSRQIRDLLYRQIVPSTQDSLPMVPNFLMAAKGPDGQMSVVMRQACYDGALGARGMHHLQSYGHSEPIYDNNAYTVTLIYLHGMLRLYTSHLGRSTTPRGRSEYYMHQLRSFAITDSADAFRDAASAYRNARDWAEEKRNAFIDAANSKVPDLEETDTSADKLA